MTFIIYGAVALTFFIVATGIAGIIRSFLSPRWQAVVIALFTAMTWAPVRWWGAGSDVEIWQGWHPLVAGWLLGEPENRPIYSYFSFMLTALVAYVVIRLWARRRAPTGVTLH